MALPNQSKKEANRLSVSAPKRRKPLSDFEKMRSDRLLSISAEELNKLTKEQLLSATKRAYELAGKRVRAIRKKHLYSPAFEAYFRGRMPTLPISADRVSKLRHEFAKLHQFLSAKTSTVKGIEELKINEARRIFGDESQVMSDEQRRRFWAAYEEFMNQNPDYLYGRESERVQQMLAEMGFWKRRSFTANDLEELLNKLGSPATNYDTLTEEDYDETGANVLAGRWYD